LFYDLIGAAKIPAEYKECVLNQPDHFSAHYTASDTHAGLTIWERDYAGVYFIPFSTAYACTNIYT